MAVNTKILKAISKRS